MSHEFPMLRLFAPEAGHPYDFLPVNEAVEWLDGMSSPDSGKLAEFARKRAAAGEWRDVAGALHRAKSLKAEGKLAEAAAALNAAASKELETHQAALKANKDGTWMNAYLAWHDQFEFAPVAAPVVAAYRALQKEHDGNADALIDEARKDFQAGNRDGAYAKYEKIRDKYYAARQYRNVLRWLEERK
jgi:thioredoxin-like negative regulator of GroEL